MPSSLNVLSCAFWGGDTSTFEILIDGQRLKIESLSGGKNGEFVKTEYEIPPDFVRGKKRVAVMIRAKENKPTAELYECAVLRKDR